MHELPVLFVGFKVNIYLLENNFKIKITKKCVPMLKMRNALNERGPL